MDEVTTDLLGTIIALHESMEQADFDAAGVVEQIVDQARVLLGASDFNVGLIEGDEIVYTVATGAAAKRQQGVRVPLMASLAGECVSTGITVRCDDSETDARVNREACRVAGTRSMTMVPLRRHGQIIGVLNVTSPEPEAFDETTDHTIEVIGGAVSVAFGHASHIAEKQALLDTLAHEARHDPLTGLPNRSALNERLDAALSRKRRHGGQAAVLFLDMDNFKEVNDQLGHEAGDAVLTEIAKRLGGCLRTDEMATRFGGDEFTVVCEGLREEKDAARIAQRISDALAGPIRIDGTEFQLTVSIGITSVEVSDTTSQLIKKASRAMSEAKKNGGARHEIFKSSALTT